MQISGKGKLRLFFCMQNIYDLYNVHYRKFKKYRKGKGKTKQKRISQKSHQPQINLVWHIFPFLSKCMYVFEKYSLLYVRLYLFTNSFSTQIYIMELLLQPQNTLSNTYVVLSCMCLWFQVTEPKYKTLTKV